MKDVLSLQIFSLFRKQQVPMVLPANEFYMVQYQGLDTVNIVHLSNQRGLLCAADKKSSDSGHELARR